MANDFKEFTVRSVRRLTDDANHNAFTGTVWFQDALYVAYRQGDRHIDQQGRVIVLRSRDEGVTFDKVAVLLQEWQPDALVVGVPFHPDGAPHENTARAQKFARQLRGRFRLPVYEVDERYSTTEALADGAADADAGAACVILEQFLRNLK